MKDGRVKLKNEIFATMARLGELVSALTYENGIKAGPAQVCNDAVEKIAAAMGTTPESIRVRSNSPRTVLSRQVCQYVMKKSLRVGYRDISRATGLSDRTTIGHSFRKVEKMRQSNPEFDKKIRHLCGLLEEVA